MKRGARAGFVAAGLAAAAGVLASLQLLKTHSELAAGLLPTYCTFGHGFDCTPVLLSPWSEFAGFPLPALSLAYYLLVLLLSAQGAVRATRDPVVAQRNAGLLLALAVLSAAQSARLAWISKTLIGSFCPFCVGLYVVSGLLLAASVFLATRATLSWNEVAFAETRTLAERPAIGLALVALAAVVLAGAPVLREVYRDRVLAARPDYRELLDGAGGRLVAIETAPGAGTPWEGPTDARVHVVLFLDYYCPYCRMLEYEIEELAARVPFRRKYMHYPHDRGCNPFAQSDKVGACLSSFRGILAGRAGYSPAWRAYAFAHPLASSGADAAAVARAAGLPPEVFAHERTDTTAIEQLVGEIRWARRAQIPATPFLLVNGSPYPGLPPAWFLERWIRTEAERVETVPQEIPQPIEGHGRRRDEEPR